MCYEWSWDRPTNGWALWIDGKPNYRLTFTQASSGDSAACWGVTPVAGISLGWMQDHATTSPLAMWIDDVAIAEHRIGCPGGTGH